MIKLVPLLFLTVLLSCNSKESNKTEDSYNAQRDFGIVSNSIEVSVLDSLILNMEYTRLNQFQETDSIEQQAYQILLDCFRERNLDTKDFIIKKVKKSSDTLVTFELNHIDYLVYSYNRNKIDAPPITGNVIGYMGWYCADIKNDTLEIILGQ